MCIRDRGDAAPANPPPATVSEAVPLGSDVAPTAGIQPAQTAAGKFAVNFGAYATAADADAVIARLKQSALPAFSEPTTINGRSAYRVRVGPYADRAEAEAARLKATQVRSDVKAQVVTLDAVSYTHLDVYKRQRWASASRTCRLTVRWLHRCRVHSAPRVSRWAKRVQAC